MINKTKKGFSLVELLVVVTIIAILSVTAFIALGGQTARARNSVRIQDINNLASTLEIFFITHNNQYPASLSVLVDEGYIREQPEDPLHNNTPPSLFYSYAFGTGNKTYQLAATMEDETGNNSHYPLIVGNDSTWLIDGTFKANGDPCAGKVMPKETPLWNQCLPYLFE